MPFTPTALQRNDAKRDQQSLDKKVFEKIDSFPPQAKTVG
jgi:hypothetical protein